MCKRNNTSSTSRLLSFMQGASAIIDFIILWIRKLWYVILISTSTPYVIRNFDEIINFQFFTQFNGKNLIFVVWIILLIIPLFDSFEGFGISIKRYYQRNENKQLEALANNNEVLTQEELEKILTDDLK